MSEEKLTKNDLTNLFFEKIRLLTEQYEKREMTSDQFSDLVCNSLCEVVVKSGKAVKGVRA